MMNKSCLLWTRVSCADRLGMAHCFAGDGFALAPTPDQHPAYYYHLLVYALHQLPIEPVSRYPSAIAGDNV
jgi:hypothetical protein